MPRVTPDGADTQRHDSLVYLGVLQSPSDAFSITLSEQLANECPESCQELPIVQILRDGKPAALGTVVGANGKILTKASLLYGGFSVRFSDGDTLPATIHKFSRKHDLAILNVAKEGLSSAKWSEAATPPVGTLVAAVVPGENNRIGVVSHEPRAIPRVRGNGIASVRESLRGVEVEASWSNDFELPLQSGDIITSVAGQPTPDLATYLRLVGDGNESGTIVTHAGDPIEVTIDRDGDLLKFTFPQPPGEWSVRFNESRRHAGFPTVFDTDVTLKPKQCGGPIINRTGQTIGIAIAARRDWGGQTHVVPAEIVRKFLED
jgi:serine protease Do